MRPALAALLLVFATQAFAAGEVYKWTDEKGVVHYTETPPPDRDFEKKKVDAAPAATPEAAAAPAPAAAPQDGSQAAAPESPIQSNCATARTNVDQLERNKDVRVDLNGDGQAEILTEEQHAAELKRNRALVEIYCPIEDNSGA